MSSQPVARPPAERTLFVAIIVLSVAALIQIVAAVVALVPRIDFDKIGRAMETRPAQATAAPAATSVDEQRVLAEQAQQFVLDAESFVKSGNFPGAMEAFSEADRLSPGKPGILFGLARAQFELKKLNESAVTLKKLLALPPSSDPADIEVVKQAQAALAVVEAHLEAAPGDAATQSGTPAVASAPAKASATMRDDVGIPIGSVMGLVKAELVPGEAGHKNLRVSMKAASGQTIDPAKVHATVDFYEQDDQGQIQRNSSPSPSEWLSSPIDWADGGPEIFQVKYRLPLEDRGDLPPMQYYGYVVAIYYDGELQDQRPDPPSLLEQYAPPLHKDPPAE